MTYKTGQSIKGYEILDRIGSGGFGAVYRAYQTTLGREVAVKIILPGYANRPEFIRRFETEAQLVARLEHLHIVPLYDYWRDPDGAFLVMRWLRGGSVKDSLASSPFSLVQAATALSQVAAGLASAHAAGVIHRDLKPSNLLLDDEGNAYLADFGIALIQGQHAGSAKILGSPDYISPEQARGEPLTPQTDIYGLGVTLYEMLAGRHPFPGLTAVERIFKHINDPLPQLEGLDPQVADDINEVIQRATAKNPKFRFEDALEMAGAFRQAAKVSEEKQAALIEALTLREQEILQLITQGRSNREIAESLFIELSTVKWYIRQIYPKLGVRNRRQAIMRARELNLLVGGDNEDAVSAGRDGSSSIILPAPANPYKGLRPFETADARDFFGREGLIADLLSTFAPVQNGAESIRRFLAIVGPSGSGKSSLVAAGLIPALRRGAVPGSERWFSVQMTPGTRPFDELEVALLRVAANQGDGLRDQLERDQNGLLRAADLILPRDGSELVLVIDQFEELFTLTEEEDERQRFLDLLATAVRDARSRVRLIIALRADYYDRPLYDPIFGGLVRSHMETLLPLSAEALEKAIIQPAEKVGVSCEAGLAARIIDEILYQPGGLPLLQYALTELFEKREGPSMTQEAYAEIGGVTGALARRAEDLFLEQDKNGREAIRQIFLRLVAFEGGTDAPPDTRRRVLRSELLTLDFDEDLIDDMLDGYAAYRLLTLDHDPASRRPTVEVAHEALLREWERLRLWLEDSRDDLYQRRRLQILALEWVEGKRDPGLLLHRTRLDQVAAWRADSDLALTRDEQAFLDASLVARQDRQAEEETRRRRELETARQLAETERRRAEAQAEAAERLRRRAYYLVAAVVLALIFAGFALSASRQSSRNAQQAQVNASAANTQEALAAERASAAVTAQANALEQAQIAENERGAAEAAAVTAANAEAAAVQERLAAEAQARLASARELSLAALANLGVDPELSVLLAVEAVNKTYLADGFALPEAQSALHQSLMSLRMERPYPNSLSDECTQAVWCSDVAFSRDGSLLAASGPGNTAAVWDAESGGQIATFDAHLGPVTAVALSPNEAHLVTASADGTAMLWELPGGGGNGAKVNPSRIFEGHTAEVTDAAFSPDGSVIATAGRDGAVKLWDVESGSEIRTLSGHESSVRDVAFSPDGNTLYSASSDFTIKAWNMPSGKLALDMLGHTDRVTDLAVSPDGAQLASASWDGTVRIWDARNGEVLDSLSGDLARVYAVAFSPDGRHLATGGTDAVIDIWDLESDELVLALPGHKGIVYNLAFSSDGSHLASGAGDGRALTWDLTPSGNREWLTLAGHSWVMFGVDFSPDGKKLATASWDGAVKLWDAETGAELATVTAGEWRQFSVSFSPDGRRLATSALNDTAALWDADTGELLHAFPGHGGPILDVAFSPDGRLLATVGEGQDSPGMIDLWDAESGELVRSWVGHERPIERVAISQDGLLLATAGTDGVAKVWLLDSGELVAELFEHESPVTGVNFSPDGGMLATTGFDSTARIWQINGDALSQVAVLQGHDSTVWDAVFSPDGSRVATISFDETVRLWDPKTGLEIMTLPGAGNNGREVDFSPDGRFLAVTTSSGLVRVYVLPVDDLLALTAERVTRELSAQEVRQYLHDEGN